MGPFRPLAKPCFPERFPERPSGLHSNSETTCRLPSSPQLPAQLIAPAFPCIIKPAQLLGAPCARPREGQPALVMQPLQFPLGGPHPLPSSGPQRAAFANQAAWVLWLGRVSVAQDVGDNITRHTPQWASDPGPGASCFFAARSSISSTSRSCRVGAGQAAPSDTSRYGLHHDGKDRGAPLRQAGRCTPCHGCFPPQPQGSGGQGRCR